MEDQSDDDFLFIFCRFLCDDTIERRIEKIQENKLQIANQVLTGAKRKTVKLTLDDMKSLFDM